MSNIGACELRSADMLRQIRTLRKVAEDGLTGVAFLALGVLPVLELVLRTFLRTGVPGSSGYVQHLTLWSVFWEP